MGADEGVAARASRRAGAAGQSHLHLLEHPADGREALVEVAAAQVLLGRTPLQLERLGRRGGRDGLEDLEPLGSTELELTDRHGALHTVGPPRTTPGQYAFAATEGTAIRRGPGRAPVRPPDRNPGDPAYGAGALAGEVAAAAPSFARSRFSRSEQS
jgi:hypothetical protein